MMNIVVRNLYTKMIEQNKSIFDVVNESRIPKNLKQYYADMLMLEVIEFGIWADDTIAYFGGLYS